LSDDPGKKVNLMKIKTVFTTTLLCLGLAMTAQAQVISQAYEVALSDFTAPATENGGVSFKQCESCDRQMVRVSAGTRYAINGKTVRLADFRRAVSQASDRDDKTVTVLHHLESNTIESIDVLL
jgi:hypothetical protein